MRNNEIISIKTKEIYCNAGDTIPLKSLGISIEKANISKKTTFNYNAGGEDVTKFIKYDEESASFVVSQENAGEVTLVIRTSNKKYPDFTINVHIGNGSVENPYYIFNESELMRIGSTYRLDSNYKLMSNITLTSNFEPIGYNSITSSWDGFSGTFDGQGYSIKRLNISDIAAKNVGFFSSLGANAKVHNLIIENATISGNYENAGVLAGVSNGDIEKVIVKDAVITNTADKNTTGAMVGALNGDIKLSYVDNVKLNVNGTEEKQLSNATLGGFAGIVNEATVQACYANNVKLNISNISSVKAGGFVGLFVIGTETGSIQQSYANAICSHEHFGAFAGHILSSNDFDLEKANMLRHLIGNFAVVYGVENSSQITDGQLVHGVIDKFFVNITYPERSVFYERESALYLIRGFASAGEVITTNEFVFYAIDMNTITTWDTTYVWDTTNNSLPTLRMGSIYPTTPSGEYFRRDLAQKDLGTKETFVDTFASNVEDQNIKLLEDVDLTNGWTPVSVKNSTIDGNNKTIRINLNNAIGGNLGLFTTLDNVTIKNLNIVVTGVSANATNGGALAGIITSSTVNSTSSIDNVTVTFEDNFSAPIITNFGGIAGTIENTIVTGCSVSGLKVNADSKITSAGAVAGVVNAGAQVNYITITDSAVCATSNAGGIAGTNAGTITNITATVDVIYNSTTDKALVAGAVASNSGTVDNVQLTTNIVLKNAGATTVGGVVATNSGRISNVTVSGNNISIETSSTSTINIGGIVGSNTGTINNVANNIKNVGTYKVGLNHYVGGVASYNRGTITKVVVQSNLYGNNVSGVVAQMGVLDAKIDQVVVGKYDIANKTLTQNEIKGDKYVAGVIVNFGAGTITNVQASSKLVGETNSTRSSLVALIFPRGATIKNATIDSSFSGYGERYRETWTDFNAYNNKAEFGYENGSTGDERFNVYKYDAYHGIMQSVVINSANSGVSGAKAAMGAAFAFSKDYQDTNDSSFIKVVNGFNDATQFQGSFTFVCATSTLGIKHEATKTLTFDLGSIWKSNNGISLMFLDVIFA